MSQDDALSTTGPGYRGAKYEAIQRLRAVKDATEQRDTEIVNADVAQVPRRTIAAELGVSPTTVYDVLRKAGRIHD